MGCTGNPNNTRKATGPSHSQLDVQDVLIPALQHRQRCQAQHTPTVTKRKASPQQPWQHRQTWRRASKSAACASVKARTYTSLNVSWAGACSSSDAPAPNSCQETLPAGN